jgi:hypothetical protein
MDPKKLFQRNLLNLDFYQKWRIFAITFFSMHIVPKISLHFLKSMQNSAFLGTHEAHIAKKILDLYIVHDQNCHDLCGRGRWT